MWIPLAYCDTPCLISSDIISLNFDMISTALFCLFDFCQFITYSICSNKTSLKKSCIFKLLGKLQMYLYFVMGMCKAEVKPLLWSCWHWSEDCALNPLSKTGDGCCLLLRFCNIILCESLEPPLISLYFISQQPNLLLLFHFSFICHL